MTKASTYMTKEAKLTTPQQRMKMKQYRQRNQAEISRKRQIRKAKIKSGAHRVKKRVGTAAGGYSFVEQPGTQSSSKAVQVNTTSRGAPKSFNPNKTTGSTSKLVKLASSHDLLAIAYKHFLAETNHRGEAMQRARRALPDVERNYMRGIEVEMEHTDNEAESAKIALDHLHEHLDYYDRLDEAGL